jgi:hypothetical protein
LADRGLRSFARLLVYLGPRRSARIIFIDIAMAQMASLGICVAVLFRLDGRLDDFCNRLPSLTPRFFQ